MNETSMVGNLDSALSHFSLVGLTALVTQAGHRACFAWSDDPVPRPVLHSEATLEVAAEVVQESARRLASKESWLRRTVTQGPRQGTGLLTVRAKAIPAEAWVNFEKERIPALAMAQDHTLDGRFLSALGEPAWWLVDVQGRSLDDGGSRWEMKTRNRGEEFLLNRLLPLTEAVANRGIPEIMASLSGASSRDDTGRGPESRTATGLRTPGPTDSVVAWCALWGLHVMPTVARRGAVSQSACVWPRRGVHPQMAVLPVYTSPVTVRRFAEVCSDRRLDDLVRALGVADPSSEMAVRSEVARDWLQEQGVRAVMRFPILKTGSASAPERQLLAGETVVVSSQPVGP